jgi:cytochrome b pre-mRNA-processing protein 3
MMKHPARGLRAEGEKSKGVAQAMYDTFQDDVEYRVHAEGVRVRVSKWLNELEQAFYGGGCTS